MESADRIKVALVDDHRLFRKGMVELINGFTGFQVVWEAINGIDLIEKISTETLPDIVLLDINMPEMNGYETAAWLKQHCPTVKILALSMDDDENAIIKMIKSGARGYILKDTEPSELKAAFEDLVKKGFYYSELVSSTLINSMHKGSDAHQHPRIAVLNERETEFLQFVCTELTYKEIADQMCLSARTIDGYREALFEKLQAKSRVGLVLYAVKHGMVKIS